MIIPLSLENAILRRLPWISIGIAVACVAVFLATWLPREGQTKRAAQALKEVVGYHAEHPYLEPPASLPFYYQILGLPHPDNPGTVALVAEALSVRAEPEPELPQDRAPRASSESGGEEQARASGGWGIRGGREVFDALSMPVE